MSKSGKHRGWLLVYELQYWVFLVFSASFNLLISGFSSTSYLETLIFILISGIPIWSLYASTHWVRLGHIVLCWIMTATSLFIFVMNLRSAASYEFRVVEFVESSIPTVIWFLWALYWHKSERAKKAYPHKDTEHSNADAK